VTDRQEVLGGFIAFPKMMMKAKGSDLSPFLHNTNPLIEMKVAAWFFLLWSIAPVFITSFKPQSIKPRLSQSTMVKQQIFGVERDIDIPVDVFPTETELQELEADFAGVKSEHGWFDSCYGGAKLHYQKWLPAGKPKAIIVFMHGIQTNAGKGFTLKGSGRKINTPLLVDGT
jgi:hypothetical protein